MPEYTASEEEQANRIIHRWRAYFYPRYFFACCGLVFLITVLTHRIQPLYYTLMFVFIISPLISWVSKLAVKPFIRRLSNEERELLDRCTAHSLDKYSSTTVQELLKANKVDTPKELLRASAKTEDDTLLRAAQSIENTSQDQLLRPTHGEQNS